MVSGVALRNPLSMSNLDGAERRRAASLFGRGTERAMAPSAAMTKHEQAALHYRQLSGEAAGQAAASGLAHVREKHERAAAVWTGLALAEDRRQAEAANRREALERRLAAAGEAPC